MFTKVDLVFSYRNFFKNILRGLGSTVYKHKIKSIVVILGIYSAYRTFGLYKSVKSALNPFSDVQAITDELG